VGQREDPLIVQDSPAGLPDDVHIAEAPDRLVQRPQVRLRPVEAVQEELDLVLLNELVGARRHHLAIASIHAGC